MDYIYNYISRKLFALSSAEELIKNVANIVQKLKYYGGSDYINKI